MAVYVAHFWKTSPIAQTFSYVDNENGIDLSRFSYIDTMGRRLTGKK